MIPIKQNFNAKINNSLTSVKFSGNNISMPRKVKTKKAVPDGTAFFAKRFALSVTILLQGKLDR
jgi:hypothetical protein